MGRLGAVGVAGQVGVVERWGYVVFVGMKAVR